MSEESASGGPREGQQPRTVQQRRLDGTEFTITPDPPVKCRTMPRGGHERWRHRYYNNGSQKEETVAVHRLAAVAWFGFDVVSGDLVVHHLNDIPWDNRESNISIMTRVGHSQHHSEEGLHHIRKYDKLDQTGSIDKRCNICGQILGTANNHNCTKNDQ